MDELDADFWPHDRVGNDCTKCLRPLTEVAGRACIPTTAWLIARAKVLMAPRPCPACGYIGSKIWHERPDGESCN